MLGRELLCKRSLDFSMCRCHALCPAPGGLVLYDLKEMKTKPNLHKINKALKKQF